MKREERILIENLGKLDNIIESMESLYPRDIVTDDSQIDVMIESLYKARLPIVNRLTRYHQG